MFSTYQSIHAVASAQQEIPSETGGEHGVFGLSYRYLDGADGYKMHSFGARAEYVF